MKAHTMLDTIRFLLGVPACAIPLSVCKTAKSYLLDKAGIPMSGTAILFAIPYLMTADVNDPKRNLSLYAVPRDYHGFMKELEHAVLPSLRDMYPQYIFSLFADHSPILEVDAAARAGLGILGDNGLLITSDYGSFVFLAEIVTDADYVTVTEDYEPAFPNEPPVCEGCGACRAACPGGCIGYDRTRCLSALTQKKGDLCAEDAEAIRLGGLVWGCDTCQLVCPHNKAVIASGNDTPISYFQENRLTCLSSDGLDVMANEDFQSRAYSWRGRAVIRRNIRLFEDSPMLKSDSQERRTP